MIQGNRYTLLRAPTPSFYDCCHSLGPFLRPILLRPTILHLLPPRLAFSETAIARAGGNGIAVAVDHADDVAVEALFGRESPPALCPSLSRHRLSRLHSSSWR